MAPLDPSQDPISPYYLHPSGNPGIKLVSEKFDGSGCNSMMISWILGVLVQNLARSVLYFNTAREIWVNLEESFGASFGTVLYALQQSMDHIEQGNDDLSTFCTKNKRLWDDELDPLPICSCDNCTCTITQKLLKLLMQEEKHKLLNNSRVELEAMAFAVNRRNYNEGYNNFDKNRQQQSFHGGFGGQRQNSYPDHNRKINYYCDFCKIPGHSIQRCRKVNAQNTNTSFKNNYRGKQFARAVHGDGEENTSNADVQNTITVEQYQQIMEVLSRNSQVHMNSVKFKFFILKKWRMYIIYERKPSVFLSYIPSKICLS
ncbi:uncharacterized protein LOC110693300 [Chenopodium quinoa]|uniref:uncharacterized protein LOC110693300 n=1 Tax=Chenopodium quinoa TaxID=63459 RepID=UPI000B76F783|nr:uncharacterized protein LOC110693300 [Chenopodium quinoa]